MRLAKKTWEKERPARDNWRGAVSEWIFEYGSYVRLVVSALALVISVAALLMT